MVSVVVFNIHILNVFINMKIESLHRHKVLYELLYLANLD